MLAALLMGATSRSTISPYDHRIEYVGRFDTRDPKGPRGSWSAVEAKLEVKGRGLFVTVDDFGPNWLQVVVDGIPTRAVQLEPGVQTLEVESPNAGVHTFEFVKRTEAQIGTVQFLQFDPEGKLLPPKRDKRLIEVVGDSISCGYGDESSNEHEDFRPATENAFLTYGSIAAREVDADVQIIAWSGRKMWPDNTMPSIYDLTVPTDPSSIYDFKGKEPEVIVVNLATNDFGVDNPDAAQWMAAYKEFLERLRYHYPSAVLYASFGGMMSDNYPEGHNALSTVRKDLTQVVDEMKRQGDRRTHLLEFDVQAPEDGMGADYHPNVKTQEKMAIKLELALKRDLKW